MLTNILSLNDMLPGRWVVDFDLSAIVTYLTFPNGDALTNLSLESSFGSYARSRKNIFVSAFVSTAFDLTTVGGLVVAFAVCGALTFFPPIVLDL